MKKYVLVWHVPGFGDNWYAGEVRDPVGWPRSCAKAKEFNSKAEAKAVRQEILAQRFGVRGADLVIRSRTKSLGKLAREASEATSPMAQQIDAVQDDALRLNA